MKMCRPYWIAAIAALITLSLVVFATTGSLLAYAVIAVPAQLFVMFTSPYPSATRNAASMKCPCPRHNGEPVDDHVEADHHV